MIDRDYRGNVGVVLFNLSPEAYEVKQGDRVAQLVLERILTPPVEAVEVRWIEGQGFFGAFEDHMVSSWFDKELYTLGMLWNTQVARLLTTAVPSVITCCRPASTHGERTSLLNFGVWFIMSVCLFVCRSCRRQTGAAVVSDPPEGDQLFAKMTLH